jgi:hypothetical protein
MKLFWGSEGFALAVHLRGVEHLVLTGVCYLGLYLDPYLLWYIHPALQQRWRAQLRGPPRRCARFLLRNCRAPESEQHLGGLRGH